MIAALLLSLTFAQGTQGPNAPAVSAKTVWEDCLLETASRGPETRAPADLVKSAFRACSALQRAAIENWQRSGGIAGFTPGMLLRERHIWLLVEILKSRGLAPGE